ncbi:low molecular weight phosphatase family protein [Mycolicibacterium litorale]|nr:low molecular weight phosphatase family protein [Mycolicibacterium litorale]
MRVLFVCTGNICRSPTAERLASLYAAQQDISDFQASSAGTRAVIGHPMHPDSARALQARGGDPAGFTARQITPRIALDADLVLTMTRAHRDAVLELAPRQLRRTFVLSEAAQLASDHRATTVVELAALRPRLPVQSVSDIPDPIGSGPEQHALMAEQIAEYLPPIIRLLAGSVTDRVDQGNADKDR